MLQNENNTIFRKDKKIHKQTVTKLKSHRYTYYTSNKKHKILFFTVFSCRVHYTKDNPYSIYLQTHMNIHLLCTH